MLPEHEAGSVIAQETAVCAGQVLSVPLQKEAGTALEVPMHMAPLHIVSLPLFLQTPPDAHDPVLPQLPAAAAGHSGSTVPDVTEVHVPGDPIRLQAWQAPEQAVLQHTPSTQLAAVDTQSAALLHIPPCGCLVPHTCVTVLHVTPAQSLSVSQLVRHCVAFRHL